MYQQCWKISPPFQHLLTVLQDLQINFSNKVGYTDAHALLEELYERMEISESVGRDIKITLPCRVPSA